MKARNLFLVFLLSILFTSCTVMTAPSNAQVNVNWDTSFYDYDQINNLGIRTYYYNHPYFIQYRRDCSRRNVRYTPYRRYDNRQRVFNQIHRRDNQEHKQPQRNIQRTPVRINRESNVTRSKPTYRSTPQRSTYRSPTPQRRTSVQRSTTTQRSRSTVPTRSRSSGNRGKRNN